MNTQNATYNLAVAATAALLLAMHHHLHSP